MQNKSFNISVIIITYNHQSSIESCLKSVIDNDPNEIVIVDNNSTDGTVEILEKFKEYNFIKIIKNKCNMGFGRANNYALKFISGDIIVFLNPDTIVTPNWLNELVQPHFNVDKIITTPIILKNNTNCLNTYGLRIHYTGLSFTNFLDVDIKDHKENIPFDGFSGACFSIKKKHFDELGGFDENFFCYMEDVDFSIRSILSGITIRCLPNSIISHKYMISISPWKLYSLEFGRYIILKKYYNIINIIKIFPSLSVVELLTLGYAVKRGKPFIKSKFSALLEGLRTKVNHSSNTIQIYSILNESIPTNQLVTNEYEVLLLEISNIIFKINKKLIS